MTTIVTLSGAYVFDLDGDTWRGTAVMRERTLLIQSEPVPFSIPKNAPINVSREGILDFDFLMPQNVRKGETVEVELPLYSSGLLT